ncbi:hypothetical protein L873DRAFT_1708743 [Choiromyces venosus 120613-1]|uniref:Uncharacterized protein n=1 Tax=Choiromyces venosus 120613-1 TaxID=1336337 RepID=A0A3N4J2X8_9PEZI|nr:hypothetical protein L873DRAFT_1708743 [Choiromyces venosus 120613-1]
MTHYSPDNVSESSSVSLKVIVPSVTVISLLVLITFTGAVIIFARAYRQRKHRRLLQEKNRRGGLEAGGNIVGEIDEVENVNAPKTGRRFFRSPFSRKRETTLVRVPPPVATTRESKTLSQNVREIVEDGFQMERGSVNGRTEGTVRVGHGYGVRHARETPGTEIYESAAVPAMPVVGKIERITGNALSNDLYTIRASGAASTKGDRTPSRRQSEPELGKRTGIAIPRTPPGSLKLDTNFPPISPATDETSAVQDLSPNYENILALSPPPPMETTLIDTKYPNVAALARANTSSAKPSNRLSYTYCGSNLTEHIATQYNPASRSRRAPSRNSENMAPLPDTPLSAAFGGFTERRKPSKGKGKRVSRDSVESGTPNDQQPVPFHRRSWSGRSVLELDAPEDDAKKETSPPPPAQPTDSTPPSTLPEFATSARLRTSAVGSSPGPLPPPILPIPPSASDITRGNHLDAALSRTYSTSKASVASMPSTISSFNTATAPINPIHGLSPTPPRAAGPPATVSDEILRSISTVITDTTNVSNFTERELEVEMARIRDRARRASDERRGKRREEERRRRDGGGGPSSSLD